MISLDVTSAKFALAFKAGELPQVDPNDPVIQVRLSGVPIVARITPKAARKLAVWTGGSVLSGKLIAERGQLSLSEAGIQFLEPPAPANPEPISNLTHAPKGTRSIL